MEKGLPLGKNGRKIRRLFWDIEVSPNVVLSWRTGYQIDVNYDGIVSERKVICIGYKWEGCRKVSVLRWDENQDDRQMLKEFADVAKEADEMVAHYGDHFDIKWFRTRCLMLGLPPLPKFKTVDTKAWASGYFYFNSNKLDYLGKALGHGGKIKTDFDLWKNITLHKCEKSLGKMCRYCGMDVVRLEQVFHDFQPWVAPKSHAGVMAGGERWTCPHDGSENVIHSKIRVTSSGTVQHQMQCKDCGAYFTISESAYRQYQKAKNEKKTKGKTLQKVRGVAS